MSKCRMWTKKTTSEKWKFNSNKKLGLEWAVNGLGNHLEKNPIQKIEKTVKIRVKLPHVNKKSLPRNRIFVQTPFSHSTLKLERKKFTPQNHSLFAPFPVSAWPKSLLQFDFKNHENVWTDLKKKKKRQRPNTTQILWIVKNQEKANNSLSYRCAAINQDHVFKLRIKKTYSRVIQHFQQFTQTII